MTSKKKLIYCNFCGRELIARQAYGYVFKTCPKASRLSFISWLNGSGSNHTDEIDEKADPNFDTETGEPLND